MKQQREYKKEQQQVKLYHEKYDIFWFFYMSPENRKQKMIQFKILKFFFQKQEKLFLIFL